MPVSPVRDGFRAAFRAPAVVLAEIAWRWTFGLAALALTGASLLAFLNTLPVNDVELLALRSHRFWLITEALGHILRGSGPRLSLIAAILTPALCLLWIAAASLGRTATLPSLLALPARPPLRPQVGLNFLRASVFLASVIGWLGAAIIAGYAASRGTEDRPGLFLLIFLALALLITLARSRVNWLLYLGAVFAARDQSDTLSSAGAAVHLFRRRAGEFLACGAMFGLIRFLVACVATVASLLVLAMAGVAPAWVLALLLAFISLVYFAIADFLYIARLAAHIALDDADRAPAPVEPAPPAPEPAAAEPVPSEPPVSGPDAAPILDESMDQ